MNRFRRRGGYGGVGRRVRVNVQMDGLSILVAVIVFDTRLFVCMVVIGIMWDAIARCSVVVSVLFMRVPRIMLIRGVSVIMTAMRVSVIVTTMGVTVIMVFMGVTMIMTSMRVAVVSMAKRRDPHKVDYEPKCADCQELADALHLAPLDQSLDRFVDNFDADEPNVYEL